MTEGEFESMSQAFRFACFSLALAASALAVSPCAAAQDPPQYVSPADAGPHGSAPSMGVKLLSESHGQREFAVIFRQGDEPYAGLTEFAAKYHIESAHFTAIGGFRDARLAWFDEQKKMFRVIPIDSPGRGRLADRRYRAARRKAVGAYALCRCAA